MKAVRNDPYNLLPTYRNMISKYSRTSINGGARDDEHSDTSPFPGYTCAKRHNILEYFCHLTVQTTKTVYLMALYREYT